MNKKTVAAIVILLLTLPAWACSHHFAFVSADFRFWSLTVLGGVSLLRRRFGILLLLGPIMLGWGMTVVGIPFVVWFPLMALGVYGLSANWLREHKDKLLKPALAMAGFAVLFYLGLGPTPLFFSQFCGGCKGNMVKVGRQIESYRFEHGEWPRDLKEISNPRCLPYEVSTLGNWIYGLQDIEFLPYGYAAEGETFRLWCRTGTHAWAGSPKGYPNYTPATGVVERPIPR